jgi:hypothetical protein
MPDEAPMMMALSTTSTSWRSAIILLYAFTSRGAAGYPLSSAPKKNGSPADQTA